MSESLPEILVVRPADESVSLRTPPGLEQLQDRAQIRFTTAAELGEALPGAQVLFLWDFFSGALESAWAQADQLKWVHVAAAGVDKLLFDDLAASDVQVTNAQGTFDRPIAEWVLAAVLAEAKDFSQAYRYQSQREWVHRETRGVQGTSALVIGTGAIGREIARLLRAVGIEIAGAGRTARENDEDFGTVLRSDELVQHIGQFDTVVNAAPLTPATTGLINAEVLAAMKNTAHLVNIGRGTSVDESALIAALQAKELGFASLDVFEHEPLSADSPLWGMSNVLVSPHMSGDIEGWKETLAKQFLSNAERWLAGEQLQNLVDKDKGYVPRH